jgi:precorrin-3B synthase
MAGVDPTELVDTSDLIAALDGLLASDAAAGCSPKFGVVVDGGGAVHVRGRALDVALGAVGTDDGSVRYDVRLAEALPLGYDPTAPLWSCAPDDALDVVAAVIDVARAFGRTRALLDAWGSTRVWDEIAARARGALVAGVGAAAGQPWSGPSVPAVGVLPHRRPGFVVVGAVARLGRFDAATLSRVAEVAERGLRMSPARGVVVTDVAEAEAATIVARLDSLGLVTDRDHPAGSVVACVGSRGCAAGFVDTLTDADRLIDTLAALPIECRPRSVHVSGCEKGCAHPGRTEWTLVGGPGAGTYTARRDEAEVARGVDGAAAVALVAAGTVPR